MWRTRPHRFAGPVVLQLLMANWSPSRNIHRTPVSPTLSSHGQKAKSFPAGKPRNPPKEAVGNLNWNRGSQSLLTMHTLCGCAAGSCIDKATLYQCNSFRLPEDRPAASGCSRAALRRLWFCFCRLAVQPAASKKRLFNTLQHYILVSR